MDAAVERIRMYVQRVPQVDVGELTRALVIAMSDRCKETFTVNKDGSGKNAATESNLL
jgi:hypothetical protein